jgi:NAD+ synthase (glutamine-hydrolysing)
LPPTAWVVVGYPLARDGRLYNAAGVLHDGRVIAEYCKRELPNYQVFDEKRYFSAGDAPCVVDIRGVPSALSICEDIWAELPAPRPRHRPAQRLLLNLNASPYHRGKQDERVELVCRRAVEQRAADCLRQPGRWPG